MTQEEVFNKAKELNKEMISNILVKDENEKKELFKIAQCYNDTMLLIKQLTMTNQQSKLFFEVASKNLYSQEQLSQIAFSICYLYKSEYDIKENAQEKLQLLCDPKNSNLKMSQIHIGIVKNLTIDEIKECMSVSDEEIVNKTKEIFCRHYNKTYVPNKIEEKEEIEL